MSDFTTLEATALERPRVSGHRGSLATDPENTVRSFLAAQTAGADLVELDLHLSADGVMVVIHDPTVDRTTDGQGRVNDLTWAEISLLRTAGGEPVPDLAGVLDATELTIQIEVKDPLVVAPLVQFLLERPELADRLILSSFDADSVATFGTRLPRFRTGLIVSGYSEDLIEHTQAIGADYVYCGWEDLTADLVARMQDAGLAVTVWMILTEEDLDRALSFGVDEVSTNDAATLIGWLDARFDRD